MSRMAVAIFVSSLVLGCASDPDWAGTYVGTGTVLLTDCAGDSAGPPLTGDLLVSISEGEDGLILGLACDVDLRLTSPTTAEIVPSVCTTTNRAGRPVTVSWVDGTVSLGEERDVWVSYEARVTSATDCTIQFMSFAGSR